MKDKKKQAMFRNVADKAARKATEQLHENLQGIAQEIARDQAEWLDKTMKDILTPVLYEAGRHGDMEEEIHAYMKKHGFKLVFIPDSLNIRMMKGDSVHSEFKTQFSLDGEPVHITPVSMN